MPRRSAGILLFRRAPAGLEVFLVHPGGPFWAKKDAGAWSIPKGEYTGQENAIDAARREFQEETGSAAAGDFIPLGELKQPRGKIVTAWALEGDLDPARLASGIFTLEWPPRSGKMQEFPEVDRGAWFPIEAAREKLFVGQRGFLDRLLGLVKPESPRR